MTWSSWGVRSLARFGPLCQRLRLRPSRSWQTCRHRQSRPPRGGEKMLAAFSMSELSAIRNSRSRVIGSASPPVGEYLAVKPAGRNRLVSSISLGSTGPGHTRPITRSDNCTLTSIPSRQGRGGRFTPLDRDLPALPGPHPDHVRHWGDYNLAIADLTTFGTSGRGE